MEREQLKRIFDFIKDKDNKRHEKDGTFEWKLLFNEPLTEEDLNVKGDLNFAYSKITSLPKGLKVGGYLDLTESHITSLPEGLKVGGNLYLIYSDINLLPKGLEVGGDLQIFGTYMARLEDDEIREMIKPGFIKGEILE